MKKYFTLIIALISLYSCASPYTISRLKISDEDKVVWRYGSEVVTLNYNGLYLEVSFIESNKDYLVFFVNVTNKSSLNYLIDPSRFYLNADTYFIEKAKKKPLINTFYALDPESHLFKLDSDISRSVANEKNAIIGYIASELVTTAVEVATESKSNNDEDRERRAIEQDNRREERYRQYENDKINQKILINNLADEREFWANKTLRKTTLLPYNEIGGLVFFKRNDDIYQLSTNFKIDDIDNIITYYQTIYKP